MPVLGDCVCYTLHMAPSKPGFLRRRSRGLLLVAVPAALALLSACPTPVAPPPDSFSDVYAGSGPQVIHVPSPGGYTFTYSLDLGSATRDVYFIFTNPSTFPRVNPAVQPVPSLARDLAPSPATPKQRGVPPTAGQALRGTPEISAFNADPSAHRQPAARALVPRPPEPLLDVANVSAQSFLTDADAPYGPVPSTCRLVVDSFDSDHRLNLWVADDCWDGTSTKLNAVTGAMVSALAEEFLSASSSDDIYHWVTAIYGPEWGPHGYAESLIGPAAGTDPQEITILLYDIQADNSDSGGVAGFYWAKDNYLGSEYAYSNQRVMFYLDAVMFAEADGGTWELSDYWPSEMVATLAHEFQHMIHFYQKSVLLTGLQGSETWITEMLSMCTEDILADRIHVDGPRGVSYLDYTAGAPGNEQGRLPMYNYFNDIPVSYWPDPFSEQALYSYSVNYAFGAFLMRNYAGAAGGGAEFLRNVMHNGYTGYRALEQAAARAGTPDSFSLMLQKWAAANLLSDDTPPPAGAAPAGYVYNAGASVDSTLEGVDYRLGSINLYNYRYYYDTGPSDYRDGPYLYTAGDAIGYADGHLPTSNLYYQVGTGLTGVVEREVYMGRGVQLTVVVK